jgi:TonB family protein
LSGGRAAVFALFAPSPAAVPARLPAPSLALSGGDGPPAPDSATLAVIQSIDAGELGALDARARAAAGQPLEPWMLATLPRLTNPRTMAGWWSELYPVRLLERGIQGEALIRFVNDHNGRVDPRTIEVLSASRPEFATATVRGARMMRFRPAMFAGQRVRVRATLPVSWRLPEF